MVWWYDGIMIWYILSRKEIRENKKCQGHIFYREYGVD